MTIRARMEPDPDGVETLGVPSPEPDVCPPEPGHGSQNGPSGSSNVGDGSSLDVQCETAPDLLPHLEFHEYEAVYDKWCMGGITTEEVARSYGRQVVEMLQAQFVLSEEVDTSKEG